jgi:hypothetical protein
MTSIRDLLDRNIEENIAPVVYFHKQDPEDLEKEVREYVITTRPGSGGESGGGIHEQYVSLLGQISSALSSGDPGQVSLPASWISGFFGSGKSSFAKLLGLALDQKTLPDGRLLSEDLLQRDDTPHASAFRAAWAQLLKQVDPMAVVFDIGAVSRSDELIHKTIYRETQKRLGYSAHDQIAFFEKLLEEEGKYQNFLTICESKFEPWDQLKDKRIAPQRFSAIYSELYPDEYPEAMDWFDLHQSDSSSQDARGVQQAVDGIREMLDRRAPGKSLFVVIDEMSQYIGLDQRKMLDVQTVVSELGARLEGRVWLLVTGQERLSDANEGTVIGKMRDRFPTRLRVHLDRANVREIVYRRLLKKRADQTDKLLSLLEAHGSLSKLRLEGYECGDLALDALVDHYPLLPGHVTLLMDISQGIRNASTRIQADSASVRGVLQIIWDLFNHPAVLFKTRDLGELVTLDCVYDILRSALNSDTLLTMDKVVEWAEKEDKPFALKVAKAIALLEMIQDVQPTSAVLIAQVLYPRIGADSQLKAVEDALRELDGRRFIAEQSRLGWRIQDHAGQDWVRQRDEITIGSEKIQERLFQSLKDVMETVDRAKLHGTPLLWDLWKEREHLSARVDYPAASVDFRFVTSQKERQDKDPWLLLSKESTLKEKFLWVSGDHHELYNLVRDSLRSEQMIAKNERQRLNRLQERLLMEEKARLENLQRENPKTLRTCWLNGELYFRGTSFKARDCGTTLDTALRKVVEEHLASVYPHFAQGNLLLTKDKDLAELFKPEITSPNPKFLDSGGLGLIAMDAGRVTFTAHGPIPTQIKDYLQENHSCTGPALLQHFGQAPYGYPKPVLKACLIALLRIEAIVLRDDKGNHFTSYKDAGAKDLVLQDAAFNRCEIIQNKEPEIGPREKVALARFFKDSLQQDVQRENEPLADAVFIYFEPLEKEVSQMVAKLHKLNLTIPERLAGLSDALGKCRRDRKVQPTVLALHQQLENLKEGVRLLRELQGSLTDETITELAKFSKVIDEDVRQLTDAHLIEAISEDVQQIEQQLTSPTPWRGYADIQPAVQRIQQHYDSQRAALLARLQEQLDQALEHIKLRPEFAQLNQTQRQAVQRQIEHAQPMTSERERGPALLVLRQGGQQIKLAEAKAHEMIDEFQHVETEVETVKVSLDMLRNRAVKTEGDLMALWSELESACQAAFKEGKIVRLV